VSVGGQPSRQRERGWRVRERGDSRKWVAKGEAKREAEGLREGEGVVSPGNSKKNGKREGNR
jgi:hypothetical protein